MVNLIVMCGLQCSGKSTMARELGDGYNAQILSSDYIREQHPDWDNEKVFNNLYTLMNNCLANDVSVIIDATNITIKSRKKIFENLRYSCFKKCYIMNTPYSECVERLKQRNLSDYPHKFGEDVIKRYYYSFEVPFYEEGWDEIIIHNKPSIESSENYIKSLLEKCKGFNQRNTHHNKTLDKHMDNVGDKMIKSTKDTTLIKAAYLHDIGKLFTQTFKEGDENAHYYSHANVGAYKLLCYAGFFDYINSNNDYMEYDTYTTLDLIFYINYHMHLFNITTEKARKKWKSIFGEDKFVNLELLHQFDKEREINVLVL
jgi:putative nucleotidyltransferase with HDIG domain